MRTSEPAIPRSSPLEYALEELVGLDAAGGFDENKSRVATVAATGESLALDAGDFMLLCVRRIVTDLVDPRLHTYFGGPEFITDVHCHP